MAILRVGTPVQASGTGPNVTVTYPGAVGTNLLVVRVKCFTNPQMSLPIPTDSAGNTVLVAAAQAMNGQTASGVFVGANTYYVNGCSAGSHTFSCTLQAGSFWQISVSEYSGQAAAAIIDQSGITNGTTAQTSTVTTPAVVAGDLGVAHIVITSGAGSANIGITAPAGFTQQFAGQNTASNIGWEDADNIAVGAGATSTAYTWTDGTTQYTQAQTVYFKAASAPSPTPNSGSITTVTANDLLFGYIATANTNGVIPGNFATGITPTIREQLSGIGSVTFDASGITPGAFSANGAIDAADFWSAHIVAYQPQPPAPTPGPGINLVGAAVTGALLSAASVNVSKTLVTAGNFLVVVVDYFQGSVAATTLTAPTYTGAASGTASTAVNTATTGTAGTWAGSAQFYVQATASGTYTFNVPIPNASNNAAQITITEWSGVATTSPVDSVGTNAHATTAQSLVFTVQPVPTVAGDLIIAGIGIGSGAGAANINISNPPTNYTTLSVNQNTATQVGSQVCYAVLLNTTFPGLSWGWTDATTVESNASAVAYKPASGGGGGGGTTLPPNPVHMFGFGL